jgi:CxxC motif-containing protein (DUF1111 family)
MRDWNTNTGLLLAMLAAGTISCAADDTAAESSEVEPNEWLPGGATTNTFLLGANAYTMPAANITAEHEGHFYSGNSGFNQSWVQAPASTVGHDGLGPLFNARSCAACHFKDGRGRPPLQDGESFLGILLRLSVPGQGPHGEPLPDPSYGGQLQPFSILGVPEEAAPKVSYEEVPGSYAGGEPFALLKPFYEIAGPAYGPMDAQARMSPRVAPAVIGLGLLEAVPLARLQALQDPDDANGDGISGRINQVWDVQRGAMNAGRFGWKAEQPSVRQQSAGAFLGDMGITSSLFPGQDCTAAEIECTDAIHGGDPELSDLILDRVELYARLLAVPVRERYEDDAVLHGKWLFHEAGCANCHVPRHQTAALDGLPEVSHQSIWPYTDLLLHDMGEGLSDDRPSFGAEGREWRTPPLWGLRFIPVVNDHDRLLHDGRARGVAEAILWHGGEAEQAKEAFRTMSAEDRRALVEFVESL